MTNPKYALVEPLIYIIHRLADRFGKPELSENPNKILVLRPTDLGDLLTATPIFQALRQRFPNSQIIAGIGSWARPIVANNPFIDDILELDIPRDNNYSKDYSVKANAKFLFFSTQISKARALGPFDLGIDVGGSFMDVLTMIWVGVRYRIGVRGYHGGWSACHRYTYFSDDTHNGCQALALATLAGATDMPGIAPQIFLTAAEQQAAQEVWGASRTGSKIRVLVGCGGSIPEKCYPSTEYGEALKLFHAQATEAGLELDILLSGGPGDVARSDQILACATDLFRSVVGVTSLRVTFALAAQAHLVITNASMLLHVAAAFHRPTLVILGGWNRDAEWHDKKWGYAPPYRSISPKFDSMWPNFDEVASASFDIVQSVSAGMTI